MIRFREDLPPPYLTSFFPKNASVRHIVPTIRSDGAGTNSAGYIEPGKVNYHLVEDDGFQVDASIGISSCFSYFPYLRLFLHFSATGTAMTPPTPRTLPLLFEECVRKFGDNVQIWEKTESSYHGMTYNEVRAAVHRCAAGLMSLGVKSGDRIALISEGRAEWVVAELGILYAGAINVPLSVKIDELSELTFRLAHAGCTMAIVSGNHAAKIARIKGDLPELKMTVLLDGGDRETEGEIGFRRLSARGEDFLLSRRSEFERTWQSVGESDPANICYTSGTVADPKGIILTHRNYTANLRQSTALFPLPESASTLLILPWDHAFAHTAGIYALSSTGASLAAIQVGKSPMETLRNIPTNLKEVRPTLLLSVPALAKNFRKGIENAIREKGVLVSTLFGLGLRVAYAYNGNGWNRGKGWRGLLKPVNSVFDLIFYRKIRESFGGRLEYFIGGGALLDIELQRFFYAVGVPMFQGYGLTEAAPVISANTPAKHKLGSSGCVVPDLEVRICDDQGRNVPVGEKGEIVVKGENVMPGYWQNEKATRETIRDGWLFTGDLGYFDTDGFLYVLGREKSLLISHDGEKYSPEGIEETIVGNSSLIAQMMLYNNQSPYTVALLVPNRDALASWMMKHHHSSGTTEGQDAALRMLEREIDVYRSGHKHARVFPERWLPSAVAVLSEPFTEQNRLLNSTMKIIRGRIAETYRQRIDFLFTPEGKEICNEQNRAVIRQL